MFPIPCPEIMNYPRKNRTPLLPGIYSVPCWWHLLPLTRPSVKALLEPQRKANNISLTSQHSSRCLESKSAALPLVTTEFLILVPRPLFTPHRARGGERGYHCPSLFEINHHMGIGAHLKLPNSPIALFLCVWILQWQREKSSLLHAE